MSIPEPPESENRTPIFRKLFLPPFIAPTGELKAAVPLSKREGNVAKELPAPTLLPVEDETYLPSPDLCAAVDVAVHLGLPLLVTGEPGMGKTRLAYAIAYQFGLPLLRFDTKSTSTIQNLLYDYDVLRRFYDAELQAKSANPVLKPDAERQRDPQRYHDYISFNPLGLAILLGRDPRPGENSLLTNYPFAFSATMVDAKGLPLYELLRKGNQRCVLLIDEIDKAPRDLPNDLLSEMERLQFQVLETHDTYEAAPRNRPIVVLTSNAEKDLPHPFLRRCAYFHIQLSENAEKRQKELQQILIARLKCDTSLATAAVQHFEKLRQPQNVRLKKQPTIAELLQWTQLLQLKGLTDQDLAGSTGPERARDLETTYGVLLKDEKDRAAARDWWLKSVPGASSGAN